METSRRIHVILTSNKWWYIIIASTVALAIAIGIGVGYALSRKPVETSGPSEVIYGPSSSETTWFPPETELPSVEPLRPIPRTSPILEDDFAIDPLNAAAFASVYSIYTRVADDSPLNAYGYYLSKLFFLEAGETIDIVFNADAPLSVKCSETEPEEALCVRLEYAYERLGAARVLKHKSSALYRTGIDWEAKLRFTADETGPFQLWVLNLTRHYSWCQYTISLTQGG